MLAASIAESVM